MPKAQAIQINWQFTGSAGIMQVEHTADCFGSAWFKSPLSTSLTLMNDASYSHFTFAVVLFVGSAADWWLMSVSTSVCRQTVHIATVLLLQLFSESHEAWHTWSTCYCSYSCSLSLMKLGTHDQRANMHKMYDGRSINKIQNFIILLMIKIWKFWSILLVGSLSLTSAVSVLVWWRHIYKH